MKCSRSAATSNCAILAAFSAWPPPPCSTITTGARRPPEKSCTRNRRLRPSCSRRSSVSLAPAGTATESLLCPMRSRTAPQPASRANATRAKRLKAGSFFDRLLRQARSARGRNGPRRDFIVARIEAFEQRQAGADQRVLHGFVGRDELRSIAHFDAPGLFEAAGQLAQRDQFGQVLMRAGEGIARREGRLCEVCVERLRLFDTHRLAAEPRGAAEQRCVVRRSRLVR